MLKYLREIIESHIKMIIQIIVNYGIQTKFTKINIKENCLIFKKNQLINVKR